MVGLDVRLEDGRDPAPLRLRHLDVLLDEVDVAVHHRQLARRLAAEQIGGAGSFVVEELPEEHVLSVGVRGSGS